MKQTYHEARDVNISINENPTSKRQFSEHMM